MHLTWQINRLWVFIADAEDTHYTHRHWQGISKCIVEVCWCSRNSKIRAEAGIPSSLSSAQSVKHAGVRSQPYVMRTEICGVNAGWAIRSNGCQEFIFSELMLGFWEWWTLTCKCCRKLSTLSMFIRHEDRINSCCSAAQFAAVPTPAESKCSKKCISALES